MTDDEREAARARIAAACALLALWPCAWLCWWRCVDLRDLGVV